MLNAKDLKVQIKPSWPHDPSDITTMADYDTMLILYRVWFNYSEDRRVLPGLVKKWDFNEDGYYKFQIDEKSKWSDGSEIKSDHLIFNLKRLLKKRSTYLDGITSIIDVSKTQIIDDKTFYLYTINKKPSKDFFERMAAAFLAVVHPSDVDLNGRVKSNTITSGPYYPKKLDRGVIEFRKNKFDFLAHDKRAEKIFFDTKRARPSNREFFTKDTWANIIQTSTLMEKELGELLISKKLPYWTRSHDRVSHIFPISKESEDKNKKRLQVMQAFRNCWLKLNIGEMSFNVKKAFSMQPEGYPLFHDKQKETADVKVLLKSVVIGAVDHGVNHFQTQHVEKCFNTLGIKPQWKFFSSYAELDNYIEKYDDLDFKLANYGVADPQPTTWMGLTFSKNLRFINFDAKDLKKFKEISKKGGGKEVKEYTDLLKLMMSQGKYVPLFHFSTLAVGKKGMSFKNIQELDETVDYSKVEFE